MAAAAGERRRRLAFEQMQNRLLIRITLLAFSVAAMAAFLNSREKTNLPPAPFSKPKVIVAKQPFAVARPERGTVILNETTESAIAKVRALFADDPEDKNGRAAELLNAYCRDGEFQIAFQLAETVPADMQHDWLAIVFARWAEHQPWEAMGAVASVADPAQRETAFQAAVDGWNNHDPANLADYALNMPASDDRTYALMAAVGNWCVQDPAAMAAWLDHMPRGDEYDYGVALMLAHSDGANRSPQVAMQWVENISNPIYKQNSFQQVLAEWMQTDSAAARQYVATANWLDDSTRAKALGGL